MALTAMALTAMALTAMAVVAMVVMAMAHTVHTARRKGEGRSSSMQDATTDAALAHVSKHHVRPVVYAVAGCRTGCMLHAACLKRAVGHVAIGLDRKRDARGGTGSCWC
jgi:hypothetical protein